MIRGSLSHVDLTVAKTDEAFAFYDQVLGLLGFRRAPPAVFETGLGVWELYDAQGSSFSIAIQPAAGPNKARTHDRYSPGLHHLAFHADSRDDVDQFHQDLLKLGVTVTDAPQEYDYTPGYYAVFFTDPDGIKLEVVYEPVARGRV